MVPFRASEHLAQPKIPTFGELFNRDRSYKIIA